MTAVAPYPQTQIPMTQINNQVSRSCESDSQFETIDTVNVAATSNERRTQSQSYYCEFNKSGINRSTDCHHITCRYKRDKIRSSSSATSVNNSRNPERIVSIPSLSSEKQTHEEKAQKRLHKYVAILQNENIGFSWSKLLFFSFGIVLLSVISTFAMTLVPAHDLIKCPDYWYESLYHATLSAIANSLLHSCLSDYFLNVNYSFKMKNIVRTTLTTMFLVYSILGSAYFIWTSVLAYQYPIPFLGNALFRILSFPIQIMIWFNYPKEWRQNDEFRKRMKNYTAFSVLFLLTAVVSKLVPLHIGQYKPILLFTVVASREIYLRIQNWAIENNSGTDLYGAKIVLKYYTIVNYSIFLCNLLSSHLSDAETCVLIAVDFSINIMKCVHLIWTKKRNPSRIHDHINILQDIVINELVEFQGPLSFMLTFVGTFYGPSSHMFGNVSNEYWDFVIVENINQKIRKWLMYYLADFSSIIINSICVMYAFKINLLKAFEALQQEFWLAFSIMLGSQLIQVSWKIKNL